MEQDVGKILQILRSNNIVGTLQYCKVGVSVSSFNSANINKCNKYLWYTYDVPDSFVGSEDTGK